MVIEATPEVVTTEARLQAAASEFTHSFDPYVGMLGSEPVMIDVDGLTWGAYWSVAEQDGPKYDVVNLIAGGKSPSAFQILGTHNPVVNKNRTLGYSPEGFTYDPDAWELVSDDGTSDSMLLRMLAKTLESFVAAKAEGKVIQRYHGGLLQIAKRNVETANQVQATALQSHGRLRRILSAFT
ncbi:MAG TPA: hypothetical protein VIH90_01945 [Candidatus Saccharimonadales bacterium]